MTSRLMKTVRKALRFAKYPTEVICRYEGPFVYVSHAYYGQLKLFASDSGISKWMTDGITVWEAGIVKLFQDHFPVGRNVIDAGANLGLHSIALAKQATRGEKIYALEPHPEIFSLTLNNCRNHPNIECINRAASDRETEFYMPSILTWENAGGAGVSQENHQGYLPVRGLRIDSLGLKNIGLMKIDVEGHELECIQGASETLQRDRPILVVEIMGGHDIRTASPEIAEEIRGRVSKICDYGYSARQVSHHDYLFTPGLS